MTDLLNKYKNQSPEIVFEWNDKETSARGWIVINSLRNGAAGGGTRMRKGLTKDEVISLAKVMEIKFTVSGPSIGGAKSGIDFDPNDPRRKEVLERWYRAAMPILKSYYGTGGDLNVDEIKDVIPLTEDLGLWHPQEGIVNGHLNAKQGVKVKVLGQLRHGCAKIVEDRNYTPDPPHKYTVADMVTGYGVAESINHYYNIYHNENLKEKRVIIQGWGNVASAAGVYLAHQGAKIVGIIDRAGGIIDEKGLDFDEVKNLFINKENNKLVSKKMITFEEANEKIWDIPTDIFVPAAASKLITPNQIDRLIATGLKVMSCGANVPFVDDKIFFGETAVRVDGEISLIPDFIANCGMARVFAYLMQPNAQMTDKAIFDDVSITIKNALKAIYEENSSKFNISTRGLETALYKLV